MCQPMRQPPSRAVCRLVFRPLLLQFFDAACKFVPAVPNHPLSCLNYSASKTAYAFTSTLNRALSTTLPCLLPMLLCVSGCSCAGFSAKISTSDRPLHWQAYHPLSRLSPLIAVPEACPAVKGFRLTQCLPTCFGL